MRLHSGEQLTALRRRAKEAQLAPAVSALRSEVERVTGLELSAPLLRAGYYHDYFCPEHAVELEFDPARPQRHRCPVDGREHVGERYSSAWRWFVNNNLYTLAYRAAVLGAAASEERHLATARSVLVDYARRYGSYEPDPNYAFSGRACFHGLDEAVMLVHLAWAFDLVFPSREDGDAKLVITNLLTPAAEWICTLKRERIHNIECWLNAALASCGALLDRDDLLDAALQPPFGFLGQLSEGVLPDGMWYESTLSYHFYTLSALIWTARACQAARPDLGRPERLEDMFAAPLKLAFPDRTLPATNDCWFPIDLVRRCGHGIPEPPAFYEVAWAWYVRSEFAVALAEAYAERSRDSVEALLFGRSIVGPGVMGPARSELLTDSGFAALREGGLQIVLKYGPHGGGHGHFDKLGIAVFGAGRTLSPDLGTPGYGVPLNDSWYRHTISHNTVMVNGVRQPAAEGCLLQYLDGGPFLVVDAEVHWNEGDYAGVRMRRAVLVRGGYFLDLFLCESPVERTFEWIYHNRGAMDMSASADPAAAPLDFALAHEALRSARGTAADRFVWEIGGSKMTLFLPRAHGERRYVAEGPFNPASEFAPLVVRRQQARHALYASVFCPSHGSCPLRVGFEPAAGGRTLQIMVTGGEADDRWIIGASPGGPAGALAYGFELPG